MNRKQSNGLLVVFEFSSCGKGRQPACKPGSVGPKARTLNVAAIPLGRSLLTASSNQPGRRAWKQAWRERLSSLFGFAPGGVCHAVRITASAVRSYRTLSPLPREARRSAFCGTFPRVTPAGRYPAPCLHGARTFLSASGAAARPTDALDVGEGTRVRQGSYSALAVIVFTLAQ